VLPLFLLVPFVSLLILNMLRGRAARRIAFTLVSVVALGQIVAVLWPPARDLPATEPLSAFLALGLHSDSLSQVLLLSIGIVVMAAVAVGRATLSYDKHRVNFVSVLLLSLAAMNGTVLLSDMFSLYVFVEVTSVCSFTLVAFDRTRDSLEGAFKYLIVSVVATVLMLVSVGLLLLVAGGTSFDAVANALRNGGASPLARTAVAAFVCGLFVKGGVVPFHGWLPGAYSTAPPSASVLLAGIMTKVSGVYGLIRLTVSVFPPNAELNWVLLLAGAVSIAVGAFGALRQTDMKWLLSYSSISQVGYIVLGLGCGTPLGVAAAILHLFNHAIFKSLLFINAAAVEQRTGTTNMRLLGGLGSRMPTTSLTSTIAVLSTAGIPPFSGFWSKLVIVIALWQSQHYAYAAFAAMLSVVTLTYLLTMQRRVFFGKTAAHLLETREARLGLVLPEVALALVTTAVGVLFPWIVGTFLFPLGGIR